MYFNVQLNGNTLIVNSDTYWNCNAYGNITLSKYSGSGNAEIDVIIPIDIPIGVGSVTFSYGDERCDYPSIDVSIVNECYIVTEPMYTAKDGGNILLLPFDEEDEAITINVYSNGDWVHNDIDSYTNGNEFVIKTKNCKTIEIKPNDSCSTNTVNILLVKKNDGVL